MFTPEEIPCRGLLQDPDDWFLSGPPQSDDLRQDVDDRRAAKRLAKRRCFQDCPIRLACLDKGLYEHSGIWGGYDERERRKMQREITARRDRLATMKR